MINLLTLAGVIIAWILFACIVAGLLALALTKNKS